MYFWRTNTRCSRRRQTSPPVQPPGDLEQTTSSDIRLVPPTGELEKTYASSLILAYSVHTWKHDVINKTGSTLYKISHCRHKRTESRPQITRIEDLVKFGRVAFEIRKQTDKHTITLITVLGTPTGGEITVMMMMILTTFIEFRLTILAAGVLCMQATPIFRRSFTVLAFATGGYTRHSTTALSSRQLYSLYWYSDECRKGGTHPF